MNHGDNGMQQDPPAGPQGPQELNAWLQNQINHLTDNIATLEHRLNTVPRRGNQKIKSFGNEAGENWLVWKNHFENVTKLNGFNDYEMRMALAASMTGAAALVVRDVKPDDPVPPHMVQPTIGHLLRIYEQRFMPEAASELAKTRFESSRQGTHENILAWHGRLRALYNEGFPGEPEGTTLIRKFIRGLRRRDLRTQVIRANPRTYQAALEAAQHESSVIQLTKVYDLGSAPEPMEIGAMADGNQKGPCHFCEKTGHWKRDCPLLKKVEQASKKRSNAQRPFQKRGANYGNRREPRQRIAALEDAVFGGNDGGEEYEEEYTPMEEEAEEAAPLQEDF